MTAQQTASDVLFDMILTFMLPFTLAGTEGNPDLARAAIIQLIEAHNAATVRQLDLVGRIIGFNTAAMDNLRLSMQPDLPDAQILRYRANAVALSRTAERCQAQLEALQTTRPEEAPRQSVKPTQPATAPEPVRASPPSTSEPDWASLDIKTMQRDAQAMIESLATHRTAPSAIAWPQPANPMPPRTPAAGISAGGLTPPARC